MPVHHTAPWTYPQSHQLHLELLIKQYVQYISQRCRKQTTANIAIPSSADKGRDSTKSQPDDVELPVRRRWMQGLLRGRFTRGGTRSKPWTPKETSLSLILHRLPVVFERLCFESKIPTWTIKNWIKLLTFCPVWLRWCAFSILTIIYRRVSKWGFWGLD